MTGTDMTGTETTYDLDETEPLPEASAPNGRRRARPLLVGAGFVVVTAVAIVGALGLGGGGGDATPAAPARADSTVQVTRATLVERTKVDGELGYGAEIPLPVKATGTVTWLPEPGARVERGDELLRVDDRPVVLLYGTLPMYRELGLGEGLGPGEGENVRPSGTPAPGGAGASEGPDSGTDSGKASGKASGPTPTGTPTPPASTAPVPMRGMDVLQFESNLAALGYDGFTVDEKYTSGTARAVKRWQKSLGLPQTGRIGVGDVIYSSGTVRIGQAGVRLGATVTENALTYTGTSRKVVVDASALEAAWAVRDTKVTVQLPDGRPVQGKVTSVGKSATAPEGGGGGDGGTNSGSGGAGATVPVTVTIADQRAIGRLESGPVTVEYVGRERKDVLTVPVAALVALAEGGHGLETTDGTFVAVKTGLFADGRVEVSGTAVREGLKVRIPR
ncbi:peptidoglycan-binding domain-containing protein [Streptomyces sp. P9(2023)]|uniref:peptidoglycan-binding domain-containing protein n=1 Tax=Streptomyces sp. P9(2023) TaxID=3064394 RepID=UPI0028F3F9C4|nr:peptidoglycan-binding domain-containing protein [Streptomyces sp. P9(2023)]MDT9692510.1 peptidoglycan-binding domain-containing protein [Streptomyces sp. P9(2023)]